MICKVFIATSLDGYIADRNGKLDWLTSIPAPPDSDMGYAAFMSSVDAVLMGRNTFDTVLGFAMEWMYSKPVYVWTSKPIVIPENLKDKVFPVRGDVPTLIQQLEAAKIKSVYVDGGKTIQAFIAQDLIQEMIITVTPIILGGGSRLFSETLNPIPFNVVHVQRFDNQMVQSHFVRRY